jgi:type III secretion protein R
VTSSTLLAIAALSLVPLLLMAATSFVKVAVVLSLVRNALGAPEVPAGAIITVLAVILSAYVMAPVAAEIAPRWAAAAPRIDWDDPLAGASRQAVLDALGQSKPPLAAFLERNAGKNERALFERLAGRAAPLVLGARDLTVLLPAFLITELKEAFQIGLLVLLPFVVIDLVITNILLALGMSMLPASAVALPFKLLLFVMIDGWYALSQALVTGYQ